jgi:acetoin utilization deacetylase AcuC-like enzyme
MKKTGFFTHEMFTKHEMGLGHPESPDRLHAIRDRLLVTGLDIGLDIRQASAATLSDLELAHNHKHLAAIQGLFEQIKDDLNSGGSGYAYVDPDTAMNQFTWEAILLATGAVIQATDLVISGELRNAFCAVRPPGHHACYEQAMGFCFVNHVAVGAKHALERHGMSRVAVVDFDVHHGNGTQNILQSDERVLMVSFYQHPFYPEGGAGEITQRMVNIPVPANTKGDAIRQVVTDYWLPALNEFRPQMIFISAGFDAHKLDDLGQLAMTENDYAWITLQLKEIAQTHSQGRIVSSLEGGYNLRALSTSVEFHLRALADLL